MMRKPSCLISCECSLSVLVGRHGAMNPAGRVRCNMWRQIEWAGVIATSESATAFFARIVLVMTLHTRFASWQVPARRAEGGGTGRFGECIARSYSRASQCFLFARLRQTKQDFICLTLGSANKWEGTMKTRHTAVLSIIAVAALGAVVDFVSGSVVAQPVEKKGTTPYVTHFIFRPLMSIDIPGLGTATNLEAVGTTQNMKGEKMLDKMSARCAALSVASGDKKYIDGACVLTDSDGDQIFSTFDTRDVDKSQPEMSCGTHIITGGTGKYKGITGSEPFACISMPALAGPGGYTAMDIPHNTTWEIK